MLAFLLSRPLTAKLAFAVFFAAQMLGWITFARAADLVATPTPTTPAPSALPEIRRALREFDRFLDHHPLLEDELRCTPALATREPFLERQPALQSLLLANPLVKEGLAIYPRYFLNRALLRQASAPLAFADLAPFKEFFVQHPAIAQALTSRPELIRDTAFLTAQPALHDFLVRHPPLARVFLPAPLAVKSR